MAEKPAPLVQVNGLPSRARSSIAETSGYSRVLYALDQGDKTHLLLTATDPVTVKAVHRAGGRFDLWPISTDLDLAELRSIELVSGAEHLRKARSEPIPVILEREKADTLKALLGLRRHSDAVQTDWSAFAAYACGWLAVCLIVIWPLFAALLAQLTGYEIKPLMYIFSGEVLQHVYGENGRFGMYRVLLIADTPQWALAAFWLPFLAIIVGPCVALLTPRMWLLREKTYFAWDTLALIVYNFRDGQSLVAASFYGDASGARQALADHRNALEAAKTAAAGQRASDENAESFL